MTNRELVKLSQEVDNLARTAGEQRQASTLLLQRIEALEQRCANLEAANAARAMGENVTTTPVPKAFHWGNWTGETLT